MSDRLPMGKKLCFTLISFVCAVLLLEGGDSLAASLLRAWRVEGIREEFHCEYDSELGWMNRPSLDIPDLYGAGLGYTTNSQRFRSSSGSYSKQPPPGRYRIICLGGSFTMGYGLDDSKTYPARMETLCPPIQTVNMGMGADGVGQDYLWYLRDGVKLDSDLLLFAFIADDFTRLTFNNFYGYPKPLLRLHGNRLVVENRPVPRLWPSRTTRYRLRVFADQLALGRAARYAFGFFQTVSQRDEPEESAPYGAVAARIFTALQELSDKRGQRFALVYLPTLGSVAQEPTPEARWLRSFADRSGVRLIDLAPEFDRLPAHALPQYFLEGDGHYSAKGARFVAAELLRELSEIFPDFPPCTPCTPTE